MSLITATNIGKSYGPVDIFAGLNFSIPQQARIALVGSNGIGKTTLLRVLLGMEEPSEGSIQRARSLRMGYLPQEAQFVDTEHSLWEECLEAFADLRAAQLELERLEKLMEDEGQAEAALELYGRRQMDFDRRGGYVYEERARMALSGLGFLPADLQRPLNQLSGGQRTRALLARLLLEEPDILLLDEPTNHLDIQAVEWLESYLKDWPGAVLIVSHDRYFLDQVASVIWEMSPALELYHGNYSAYLSQREERYQRRLEEYQAMQAVVEKEEDYIRRNIAGQNTRQAQGRRKRLETLLAEASLTPPIQPRHLRLQLKTSGRSGDLVLRTRSLSVGYADEGRPLFSVPNLVLMRGECAAIIGPNGAGKTTFLKTILEKIPPFEGQVSLGASLKVGYFAQAHEELHADLDLIAEIQTAAPEMRPSEARDYLARFLFRGEDVFKPVSVLSGGERGRLALAKLSLGGANLLLLDEPTNHLDLPSQEILQTVLSGFAGTILLVSHDRYLIDALATQVWEVVPQSRLLNVFDGTYSEYKAARLAAEQAELEARAAAKEAARLAAEKEAASSGKRLVGPSKETLRKHQSRIDAVEQKISSLEAQLAAIHHQLENPQTDSSRTHQLSRDYVRIQDEIEVLLKEWEELHLLSETYSQALKSSP